MSTAVHDIRTAGDPRIEEVSDGIYAYIQPDGSWWINNTGFLVGATGVVSVDTCATERRTRDYLAAVQSVSKHPIRTLINTHHHGDHTNGNYLLAGATIVAHEDCRAEVIAAGQPSYKGIACDLGAFSELHDVERIVGNLHRAYAELDGTPRGGRIDVRAALMDMVTYNGGHPLTCLA
jgi:glyoxylase-like metal-dependent hydrolase (beta-lactamase superfamily II)